MYNNVAGMYSVVPEENAEKSSLRCLQGHVGTGT